MRNFLIFTLAFITVLVHHVEPMNVNGDWGPWEIDPEIDCCMYGGYEKVFRYCNNPSPEGTGSKCTTTAAVLADKEEKWRACTCTCSPMCDNSTAFCANDTGQPAHCACNWGKVPPAGFDPQVNTLTSCVDKSEVVQTTTEAPKTYNTLDSGDKDILKWVQIATVAWLLICLIAVLTIFFVICYFKPDRIIHMNEEITLIITYILIGFLIEETDPEGLCTATSAMVHYFFTSTMVWFILEALHVYSILTYIVPSRGFFHTLVNLGIGYGVPLIVVAPSVGALLDEYGNFRHCWCDLGTDQAWAFLFPIAFLAFVCTVIAEAQGQGKYKSLPDTDHDEFLWSRVSQGSIMIVMPLTVASYVCGLLAVDMQRIWLYAIFFILNIILGPVIFFFHCIGNSTCRSVLARMCPCLPCFKKNADDRPASARVGPSPDDTADTPAKVDTPRDGPGSSGDPPASPKGPDTKETDVNDFYKWVSDGKQDNIDKSENVLFEGK